MTNSDILKTYEIISERWPDKKIDLLYLRNINDKNHVETFLSENVLLVESNYEHEKIVSLPNMGSIISTLKNIDIKLRPKFSDILSKVILIRKVKRGIQFAVLSSIINTILRIRITLFKKRFFDFFIGKIRE